MSYLPYIKCNREVIVIRRPTFCTMKLLPQGVRRDIRHHTPEEQSVGPLSRSFLWFGMGLFLAGLLTIDLTKTSLVFKLLPLCSLSRSIHLEEARELEALRLGAYVACRTGIYCVVDSCVVDYALIRTTTIMMKPTNRGVWHVNAVALSLYYIAKYKAFLMVDRAARAAYNDAIEDYEDWGFTPIYTFL